MAGKYTERLPCGGTLEVTNYSWEIEYYFPGPDRRHSGEIVRIQGSSLEKYIDALIVNWSDYKTLKATIPHGGQFTKHGKLGMSIHVGGYNEGICLRSYHMPINTEAGLENIITSYRYALLRAPQVAALLEKL